jgi:hypothetical protein
MPDNKMIDRLRALLGPNPNNPWEALLPQLLLWCFRRFCVEKLLTLGDALLLEQVWDDHFDLVRNYAPRGLQNVGPAWLLPDHLATMHSTEEDFNQFFLDVLEAIDIALAEEDEAAQGSLSDMLDRGFREAVVDWLDDAENPLLIYPLSADDDDQFPDMRLVGLIRMIMAAGEVESETEGSEAGSEESLPEPEPAPAPPENTLPPNPLPAAAAPAPAAVAMATAAKRRRTYRRRGRRANRGSTLRIKRIRRQTRGAKRATIVFKDD